MSLRWCGNRDNAPRLPGASAAALAATIALSGLAAAPPAVRPGIDVWVQQGFAPLAGKRIGLITNITGRAADGRLTLDILAAAQDLELRAIFTPEHALLAMLEGEVDDGVHAATGLPIFSLYGDTRRPTAAMLEGLDGLVFDIQDIGTRFYTYATTLGYAMEEVAVRDLPIVVLDRPNPIGGVAVSGAVLQNGQQSFVAYSPVPVRHGMTIGELARLLNVELGIGARLTVIPVHGWRRDMWYDETGLRWVDPSPNIRNLAQSLLYPALGPLETTNISVGRGTDAPFEWLGAPWIDGQRLAARLNAERLPGIGFLPRRLTPETSKHAGIDCDGVNLLVTDRDVFDAGLTAATIATTLRLLHPQWDYGSLTRQWGDPGIIEQLDAGWSAPRIVDSWTEPLQRFLSRRDDYLLYR